ncbi:MAG: AMP-binding protein, partial [Isosphaeraceae bacterium]
MSTFFRAPSRPATLGGLLPAAARKNPHGVALVETSSGRHIRYAELESQVSRLAAHLLSQGIGLGHRVGLWLPKSFESVATIHASLRVGAAHVPVDPLAPAARAATIFSLAGVSAVVVHKSFVEPLKTAWPPELANHFPTLIIVEDHADGPADTPIDFSQKQTTWQHLQETIALEEIAPPDQPDSDLAYILFTSGSTGQPKGV